MVAVGAANSVPKNEPIQLRESDIRWDFFKSPGAGGQRKNKVISAVRATHLPTGIVVTATEQRHQRQNKQVAWDRLEERLAGQAAQANHAANNEAKQAVFEEFRNFTWTDWRDEVKGPNGKKTSMRRALTGRLSPLLC